uniref:DNA oxidative demethylase ALKBH2 n=1 Tax=Lepisosteus oculatus TaxID=7918 RepID=W5MAG9_LEPOC|nr:PREDICTED: DNA oxidative demethylase ALKBH2 [Lepisosteus oculatus]XP_015221734.1 PREDICTED: DNA oxidative demethylase ALKBH2 [Lepisosteus oculatus]XP_015221735.1 PREDICTED: DNA oxidative demethylase ALKBH2 [Lepisosteus oculatus]XP_015221736.1 PREDICTED: DNA oxidative demethylase ALKBH2 [Lepisosteus oculatus]
MDRFVTRTKKRPATATAVAVATHNELETTDERKRTRCAVSGDEEEYDCPSEGEFSAPLPWQKIEAEALDLDYTVLFSKAEADRLFKKLEEEIEYFSGEKAKVQVFGKFYNIPRKQATYGDPGLMYSFSGVHHLARPWTPVLEYIRDCVTKATGHTFNFVLVNRYRDGGDHMGEHRDDERELDPACPIASVSFGAARDLVFKHQDARGRRAPAPRIAPVRLELQHGSLLLMNPPTNARWYHSLPVRKRVPLPRVNLTFRRILRDGRGRAAPAGHSAPP